MSWPLVPLSYICDINIGKTPSRSNPSYWGEGYPWLSIADMNQGRDILVTKEEITESAVNESNIKIVPKGTVLFSFKLSIGKIGITQRSMYTNEAIAALPIKDQSRLCNEYLIYALTRIDASRTTDRAVMGATLNKKKLSELKIPLPPLKEQKRIAAILDKADAIRRKRQQAIQLANELLRSVFLDMFGNQLYSRDGQLLVPMEHYCERIVVGHVGSTSEFYTESGVNFLRTQNVRPMWIDERDMRQIMPEFHDKLKKSQVAAGDILISRVGANRGMAAVVPQHLDGANCANIIVARTNKLGIPEFIAYLVNSEYGQNTLVGSTVGAAQGVINTATVKEWLVPNVAVEKQRKFVDIYQKTIAGLNEQKQHATNALGLFRALLQRAFRGEL